MWKAFNDNSQAPTPWRFQRMADDGSRYGIWAAGDVSGKPLVTCGSPAMVARIVAAVNRAASMERGFSGR